MSIQTAAVQLSLHTLPSSHAHVRLREESVKDPSVLLSASEYHLICCSSLIVLTGFPHLWNCCLSCSLAVTIEQTSLEIIKLILREQRAIPQKQNQEIQDRR